MKTKILLLLLISILSIHRTFAYTPSLELEEKLKKASVKIDVLIENRGENYRLKLLNSVLIEKEKYTKSEMAQYIFNYILDHISQGEITESKKSTEVAEISVITKTILPYHNIDECFQLSNLEIKNPYLIYPYDADKNSYNTTIEIDAIYQDTTDMAFYSNLTLENAPNQNTLKKIVNRCVYIQGDKDSKNQTSNVQIGLEIASANKAYMYIEKDIYADKMLRIKSDTTIIGIGEGKEKSQIAPYNKEVGYFMYVQNGAENISIRDIKITEEEKEIQHGFIFFAGENSNIKIQNIDFIGKNVSAKKQTRGLFFSGAWAKDILIRDSNFTNIENSIHFFTPVQGLQIFNNSITKWTDYAILINRPTQVKNKRSENIEIRNNEIYESAAGGQRGVILVSGGREDLYVRDVEITSNIIRGNGGSHMPKNVDPDYSSNNAHGDQIVLHRVNEFLIAQNNIYDGGENGITVSRLSRNGRISNNDIYHNDTHGINIGSAYFELQLNNIEGLKIGDRVRGVNSLSEGTITLLYPDLQAIGIEKVNVSTTIIRTPTFLNESLEVISRSGVEEKTITGVDRTKLIEMVDNRIYGNGMNREAEYPSTIFSAIYIINADSITMRRNAMYNDTSKITQRWAITASRSRNLYADETNTFEHSPLDTVKYKSSMQLQSYSYFSNIEKY